MKSNNSKQKSPIKERQTSLLSYIKSKDTQDKKQQQKAQSKVKSQQGSQQSIAISKNQKQDKQPIKKQNTNVLFYTNKIQSQPSGDFIDKIHKKWWGNFQLLQSHHGFIQWLFPNSFKSRFNSASSPLSQKEAAQFRTNIEISQRYQRSYMMMLQFYGLKLKCKQSGQVTFCRHPAYKQRDFKRNNSKMFWEDRFYKTFLTSFHNHMRITRILSSLVICGFGKYARQFSIFLGNQINKQGGKLADLKKYGIYQREWKQYSQYSEKQDQTNVLLKSYDKKQKK